MSQNAADTSLSLEVFQTTLAHQTDDAVQGLRLHMERAVSANSSVANRLPIFLRPFSVGWAAFAPLEARPLPGPGLQRLRLPLQPKLLLQLLRPSRWRGTGSPVLSPVRAPELPLELPRTSWLVAGRCHTSWCKSGPAMIGAN